MDNLIKTIYEGNIQLASELLDSIELTSLNDILLALIQKYYFSQLSQDRIDFIEKICKKSPSNLITKEIYNKVNYHIARPGCFTVIRLFNKYYVKKEEDNDFCMDCLSYSPNQLIETTCNCINKKIHLSCLLNKYNFCNECKSSRNSHICPFGRINFPKANIYRSPLMSHYIFITNIEQQLTYACAYLIVERVKEILDSFPNDDFRQFIQKIKGCNDSTVFVVKYQYLMLVDNPFTNMQKEMFPTLFKSINKLLSSKVTFLN